MSLHKTVADSPIAHLSSTTGCWRKSSRKHTSKVRPRFLEKYEILGMMLCLNRMVAHISKPWSRIILSRRYHSYGAKVISYENVMQFTHRFLYLWTVLPQVSL